MQPGPSSSRRAHQGGFTLIEVVIAFTVMTIILLATSSVLRRETRGIAELQNMGHSEKVMEGVFNRIFRTIQFARGFTSETTLSSTLTANETGQISLGSINGFPDQGSLVVDRGEATEETINYEAHATVGTGVLTLERGAEGTQNRGHNRGSSVIWSGLAYPIANQTDPDPSEYDGTTDDLRGDIYFIGKGLGLSYQVPVDPVHTGSYLEGSEPRWGAQVSGGEVAGAYGAVVYVPSLEITEADRKFDLNEDGDEDDTFYLGRIALQSWSTDPGDSLRINLTPSIILQEKGAYGSDMDADGFEDPMFLWSADQARLRLRFFVLTGTVNGHEVVRRFENIIHLSNGSAE